MHPSRKDGSPHDSAPKPQAWGDCYSGHRCCERQTDRLPLHQDIKSASSSLEKLPAERVNECRAPRGRRSSGSLVRICLACGITSIQLWLRHLLRGPNAGRSASTFRCITEILTTNYPVCDASRLEPPRSLPIFLRDWYSCESLIIINLGLILLYWALVVDQFWVGKWRQIYLPWVCLVAATGLLLATPLAGDLAVLLLDVAPLVWDSCMIGCLVCDVMFSPCRKGAGRRVST